MDKIIKKPQTFKPCWVRKSYFRCEIDEVDEYYNWINQNKEFIVFGYGEFRYRNDSVAIPVYYLEKEDLASGSPYRQSTDWVKFGYNDFQAETRLIEYYQTEHIEQEGQTKFKLKYIEYLHLNVQPQDKHFDMVCKEMDEQ